VGDGIEGLVHISEMAVHHVDQPDQVVTPGEELWVKIIDIDLARRRISLSIKQAAEGGEVAAEYREAFGEHAYDEHGNYIGAGYTAFEPESEAQAAWAGYLEEQAHAQQGTGGTTGTAADDAVTEAAAELIDEAVVSEATAVVEVAAAAEAVAAAEAALAEEAAVDDEIAELGVDAVEEAALEEDAAAEGPAAAESPAATPPRATAKAKETASEEGPAGPTAR
jgi:predicted RNA-binding protein with RPS1 domain